MSCTNSVSKVLAIVMFCFLALTGVTATSHAQTITLYNSAGRVIRTGNPFPYDRFSRGEVCNVSVCVPDGAVYSYVVRSARGVERGSWNFCWGYWDVFRIPTSPAADNLMVEITNLKTHRKVSSRIPIGTK